MDGSVTEALQNAYRLYMKYPNLHVKTPEIVNTPSPIQAVPAPRPETERERQERMIARAITIMSRMRPQ